MPSKRLIKFLSSIFFIFFIVTLSLYLYLREGATVKSLQILGYQVKELYLKLDKKIILRASYIGKEQNISTTPPPTKRVLPHHTTTTKKRIQANLNSNPNRFQLSNVITVQKYLNQFLQISDIFDYVSLNNINFKGKNYLLSLSNDKIIHFNSDKIEFAGKILKDIDSFVVKYPFFYFKKLKLLSNGEINYSLKNGVVNLSGRYVITDIQGDYKINIDNDNIDFKFNSDEVVTFKNFFNMFRMGVVLKEWLYNRIQAKKYKLIYLKGRAKLIDGKFRPILNSIEAKVKFEDLNVTFHSQLPPIKAKSATATLKNKSIVFEFSKPKYEDRDISGSRATLMNINSREKISLKLNIKYRGSLDKKLVNLLNKYGLDSKITQEKGHSFGIFDIFIPFQKGRNLTFKSDIDLIDGKIKIGDKEEFYLKNSGKIKIKNSEILVKKLSIKKDNLTAKIDAKIDIKNREGDIKLLVKKFLFSIKNSYIEILNKKLSINMSWNRKERIFKIPDMKTTIKLINNGMFIKIDKLSLWKRYIKGDLSLINGGKVKIRTNNMKNYSISTQIYWYSSPFYKKNRQVSNWKIKIKASKNRVVMFDKNRNIFYNSQKNIFIIKNLNIDVEAVKKLVKKIEKVEKKDLGKKRKSFVNRNRKGKRQKRDSRFLTIIGRNSSLIYKKHNLNCREYILQMRRKDKKFVCKIDKYKITAFFDKNGLKRLFTKNIDAKTLYKITKFNEIKKAKYRFDIKRDKKGNFTGKIFIRNGLVEKLKGKTGFGEKGFQIDKGKVVCLNFLKKEIF